MRAARVRPRRQLTKEIRPKSSWLGESRAGLRTAVGGGIGSPQPETETLPSSRPRSQLLPIGAPASACPRRHLLTGRPWRLVEASCTLGPALCTSPCSVTPSASPSASRSFKLWFLPRMPALPASARGGIGLIEVVMLRRSRSGLRSVKRGWDSNPRSRAHEAREDSLSSTAQSARLESNQRSPVPETGGVAVSPTSS